MILIEFTPVGHDMVRCALDDYVLEHQWFSYLASIDTIKYRLTKKHGGCFAPEVGQINFTPEYFATIGEYPATGTMRILRTDTNEAGATVIHDGTSFLDEMDRTRITYDIAHPEMAATIPASTAYNDNLANVVTALCDAAILDLAVDLTRARAISPAVLHTTTSEQTADALLAEMCAWFCHGYKIVNGTLYLIDLKGTPAARALTEFDVQPCRYRKEKPYSLFKCGDNTLAGSNPAGTEEYDVGQAFHTTSGNIDAALADIKLLMEMDTAIISSTMDQIGAGIADRITLLDESMLVPVTAAGIITSIIYSPDDRKVEAEAIGSVTT